MSTISSANPVVASGYLSSAQYGALSSSQQSASDAAQNQINNEISLVNSAYSGASAPSLFTSTSSTTNAAAATGLATEQSSELELVSSLGGESGFSNGIVSQSAMLQSFVRNGMESLFGSSSPSADAASGQATQLASQQALIASLYSQANGTSSLTGTRLNQFG